MPFVDKFFPQIREFAGHYSPRVLIDLFLLVLFVAFVLRFNTAGKLQRLWDPIPCVFNTLQFLLDNERFMIRVKKALKNANIAKFHLGKTPVYLVSGPRNIQTIFRRSRKVGNEQIMVRSVLPVLYRMSAEEVKRFDDDKSGRGRDPAPDAEETPSDKRYWSAYEHVHSEYLARTHHLKPIIDAFGGQFSNALNRYPLGKWTSVSIIDFCRREVTECAIVTLLGPEVLKLNSSFLDAFWEFDENVFALTLGFPRWLNPRPYRVQERFLSMIEKYLDEAWADFDWDGPSVETYWEPQFGARVCRELVKWLRSDGFHSKAIAGALGVLLFAQNSNSIPTTMWMIIELAKDTSLFQAVRQELATAYATEPETGTRSIDTRKLVTLPLLQSVFTETLRLHMNFNIIRNVKEPVTMDGVNIGKGSMFQAPMLVAHYDEAVWGVAGHPASEFWAERHLRYTEDRDGFGHVNRERHFAMAGRPTSFFPFGGGPQICPGRHLAKQEILTTIGLLVSRFDFEFVEWRKLDGSVSDRPAKNDQRYCGTGAMPPDRDMRIRWKRVW